MKNYNVTESETPGVALAAAAKAAGIAPSFRLMKRAYADGGISYMAEYKGRVIDDIKVIVTDETTGAPIVDVHDVVNPETGEVSQVREFRTKTVAKAGDVITQTFWARRDATPEDVKTLEKFGPITDVEINYGVYNGVLAEKPCWVTVFNAAGEAFALNGDRNFRGTDEYRALKDKKSQG